MNYYTEIKIKSYKELSETILKIHVSGLCLGWYFHLNKIRIFSDNKNDLCFLNSEISQTPEHYYYIKCERVRSVERQTPTQREKRLDKLRVHLAKRGIEFKADRIEKPAKYDYFINIKSLSSNYNFRLFIKNTISKKEIRGKFTSYGLSLNNSNLPYWSQNVT